MNTLILRPRPAPTVVTPAALPVYVAGRRRRDIHAIKWTSAPGPRFGEATFVVAGSGPLGRCPRIEQLPGLPAIGESVRIHSAGWRREVLFDGTVTAHLGRVGPDAEELTFEAADALHVRLGAPVAGRWQADAEQVVAVADATAVFNDELDGLTTAETHPLNGRAVRVFANGGEGGLWSVADILAYLLAAHVPADVAAPGSEELAALAGDVYPPRMDLSGLTVGEAICRVAEAAGLAVRGGVDESGGRVEHHLAFHRPDRNGRRRAVRLQRAGETLDLRRSDLWQGRFVVRRRPGRRSLLLIGDHRRHEVTVELHAGWDKSLESYHYRDFVADEAADWAVAGEVFRKWVLNESGRYDGPPWDLERFDFASIDPEDFLLAAPRVFRPCLSRGPSGEGLGVVVETSTDEGATWRRYGGSVRLAVDECAVTLTDTALPADTFQAALGGTLRLRVTATIAADRRLSVRLEGAPGAPLEVVRAPNARWAKAHPTSAFFGRDDLPAPAEVDDTERVEALARQLQSAGGGSVEAEIVLARLDPTWRVGDIVERVDGRGLDLRTFPGAAACVAAVEHRCNEEWTTLLTVRG